MNNENVYEKLYKTKDLAEAGFLIAKAITIESIERENGICWFIFQNKEKCEKLVNKFWFGNSTVEARKFYEAIHALKNRIFNRGDKI